METEPNGMLTCCECCSSHSRGPSLTGRSCASLFTNFPFSLSCFVYIWHLYTPLLSCFVCVLRKVSNKLLFAFLPSPLSHCCVLWFVFQLRTIHLNWYLVLMPSCVMKCKHFLHNIFFPGGKASAQSLRNHHPSPTKSWSKEKLDEKVFNCRM